MNEFWEAVAIMAVYVLIGIIIVIGTAIVSGISMYGVSLLSKMIRDGEYNFLEPFLFDSRDNGDNGGFGCTIIIVFWPIAVIISIITIFITIISEVNFHPLKGISNFVFQIIPSKIVLFLEKRQEKRSNHFEDVQDGLIEKKMWKNIKEMKGEKKNGND